jgi:hypothetical protein
VIKKELKMNVEYLEKEQDLINGYIYRFCCDKITKSAEPIYDGIVNIEKYIKSKYKICWILKEPYDEDNGKGGGWSLTNDILNQKALYPEIIGNSPTWQPMVYVTYSLLHGFISWKDMDWIRDEPEMAQCLNEIALINVNKMPASHRSDDSDIATKYEYWKPILHWQLKQYDPQILIFGNTFEHFKDDLKIKDNELESKYNVVYVVRDKKIYAHAYHPAQTRISRGEYVQGIINVIKLNIDKI